eukprot:11647_5
MTSGRFLTIRTTAATINATVKTMAMDFRWRLLGCFSIINNSCLAVIPAMARDTLRTCRALEEWFTHTCSSHSVALSV